MKPNDESSIPERLTGLMNVQHFCLFLSTGIYKIEGEVCGRVNYARVWRRNIQADQLLETVRWCCSKWASTIHQSSTKCMGFCQGRISNDSKSPTAMKEVHINLPQSLLRLCEAFEIPQRRPKHLISSLCISQAAFAICIVSWNCSSHDQRPVCFSK
jgi:hypothetical protein